MNNEQDLVNEIFEYFHKIGVRSTVNVHIDMNKDLSTTTTFTSAFKAYQLEYFVKDLRRLKELDDERHLRESNQTLERAYNDYQLLLKLSK